MDQILTPTTMSTMAGFESRLGRSVLLDQAARMLGVSRRTIYYWIRHGRLQTIRTLNGSQRVLVESLREHASEVGAAAREAAGLATSPDVRRLVSY